MYNYLFGTPAIPRKPSTDSQSDWFVLGAYPSALHVRWEPTMGKPISAIAVDDEPEPFLEGEDQGSRIKEWSKSLPWNPAWGKFSSPGELNGSSGRWLAEQVLTPLGIPRTQTWITDCIDIYHESKGAAKHLNEPLFRDLLVQLRIKDRNLPSHPSEDQIVGNAQLDRLRTELASCLSRLIITLGNAALRVLVNFIEGSAPIRKLAADSSYGQRFVVRIAGSSSIELLPLAHPGARGDYPLAHANWLDSQRDA